MSESTFFQAIPMTVYDTSGLAGTYASLNGTGTEEVLKILKMYNGSDVGITLSYDNVDDHDFIPAGGTFIIDLQTNSHGWGGTNGHWAMKLNQVIYGKGSAGAGNLYIIGYY